MKKVDVFALSISLILNFLLLFIIPNMGSKEVVGKIKVGLVALDNQKNVNYSGKKEVKKEIPIVPPKKEIIEKKEVVAPVEKVITLEERLKEIEIQAPKMSAVSKKSATIKKIPEPKAVAEKIEQKEYAEEIINTKGNNDGIPSGYKLGALDGDVVANWDSNNRDPEYPEAAQLRGLNGTVKLRLTIDKYGNVLNSSFESGSGVPEINLAIEKVARTWKINLTKKGNAVKGDVILEYRFRLGE
ncbi:MAG: energy transducer TonB [Fusobacteriaceae bacterium]